MFSRFASAGRMAVRTGRRSFNSSAGQTAGRRFAGYATVAAAGALGVTFVSKEFAEKRMAYCAPEAPKDCKNSAFVFIKPHAVTESTKELVAAGLKAKGLTILSEGTLTAAQIDEGMLIDQHYYAIASKATILKPHQLNVPPEKFQKQFGLGWQEALDKGVVYNAKDACDKLGLDAAGLNAEWAKAKKAGKLVKFGGGFYCGMIDTVPGQKPIYVFNGFFMNMRNDYVKQGAKIHYYVVEWNSKKLSWEDFRNSVLGPTDPADCPADSLRGLILAKWQALGLPGCPNVGENGVHASASPFEALAERMNWLGVKLEDDNYGQALLGAGIPKATIEAWSVDPVVTYGAPQYPIKKSLFDSLEDTDADMCLARAMMINGPKSWDLVQVGSAFAAGALAAVATVKATGN